VCAPASARADGRQMRRRGGRSRPPASYNPPVHYVYIVRCADGTLYTGYALDPHARERQHNSGRGAHYTACRRPVSLVYSESFPNKSEALRREHTIKRWRRTRKEALVNAIVTRES
jgi:putative endonuclease